MAIEPKAIHDTDSRQVHLIGDYVAVCYNTTWRQESHPDAAGRLVTVRWQERVGAPYIDFVWMRQDRDGTWYEDEDNPVSGGFTARAARQVAEELLTAVQYLDEQTAQPLDRGPGQAQEG